MMALNDDGEDAGVIRSHSLEAIHARATQHQPYIGKLVHYTERGSCRAAAIITVDPVTVYVMTPDGPFIDGHVACGSGGWADRTWHPIHDQQQEAKATVLFGVRIGAALRIFDDYAAALAYRDEFAPAAGVIVGVDAADCQP